MAKFKYDSNTQKNIKTVVLSELRKNPAFLGCKGIKVCKDKYDGYSMEKVNVFIQQTDNKAFKVWLWNLSNEFNALFILENALMKEFSLKHISTHMADSKSNHQASTIELKF